ncbi:MAG: hypothetical protein RLN69_15385 [Woeseiaceae bacterium]
MKASCNAHRISDPRNALDEDRHEHDRVGWWRFGIAAVLAGIPSPRYL